MLHPPLSEPDGCGTSQGQLNREAPSSYIDGTNCAKSSQQGVVVTAATGAGEGVCLSVVFFKSE